MKAFMTRGGAFDLDDRRGDPLSFEANTPKLQGPPLSSGRDL